MENIPQISAAMRRTLIEEAERLGRASGFVKRASKLGASEFVQAMVFGVMRRPMVSYTDLCLSAEMIGIEISPQGIEQRFTLEATELLNGVLQKAIEQKIRGSSTRLALLQRFNGVYVRDSCSVSLPKEWCEKWPGVGSAQGPSAGIKLHVRLNFNNGELAGPKITNGRVHDRKSPFHEEELPAGGLRIADLGFFDLEQMAQDAAAGIYWLSRYKVGTVVFDPSGQRINLTTFLRNYDLQDMPILLGQTHRIPCRLLVQRVPQEVADQRRRRLYEYATRKQVPVSEETLFLAQWTLMVTNVPTSLLSLNETLDLYRLRWQIELLFKLWKQHAHIDEWRSHNPFRILCEFYAKLIAVLFMHWQFVPVFWAIPARSLFKATQRVQSFSTLLTLTFKNEPLFLQALELLQLLFLSGCSLNPRKSRPNTFQRLAGGLA